MDRTDELLKPSPELSIIIAVHNDWEILDACLSSLTKEMAMPFEVIVVDDGSKNVAPDPIRSLGQQLPLTILRKKHEGVSLARNLGIRASRAPLLLFVDADCRLQPGCLGELASAAARSPEQDCFQLRLVGDCSTKTGRAEELRLATLQHHMIQPDGRIRYLNTAGFAVRRRAVDIETGLFSPLAIRGEDTLLLVELLREAKLPLFVPRATVQHSVPSSFLACLRKDVRSGYLQSGTYAWISKTGLRVRMTNRTRLRMLIASWRVAGQQSIGRAAWFLLLLRQMLERSVSLVSQLLNIYPKTQRMPSQKHRVT